MHKTNQRFIIISSYRCGSTYLATLLDSHPDILCHWELFNKQKPAPVEDKFLKGNPEFPQMEDVSFRFNSPADFLALALKGFPVCGFKLLEDQIDGPLMEDVVHDRSYKKIILVRKNIVRQFFSLKIAKQNKVWCSFHKKNDLITIRANKNEVLDFIELQKRNMSELVTFFREKGHEHCVVYYEDLGDQKVLARIQDFLGVKAISLSSKLVRQNPYHLKDIIANYEKLKDEFAGTGYEEMFQEDGSMPPKETMYCLVNIPEYILKEQYIKYRSLKEMDENTGNCLFWESTKNILRQQDLKLLSIHEYTRNPSFYFNKISKVVICSANLIANYSGPNKYWVSNRKLCLRLLLGTLSTLNCKKYMISIGAQSHDLHFFKFTEDQKKNYIDLFSQFDVIYLRGEYTHGLLEYNGISLPNMLSLGCPSLLLRPIDLDELRSQLDRIRKLEVSKINIGIGIGGMMERKDITNNFINLMADKTIHVLVQSDVRWVGFITRRSKYPPIELYRPTNDLREWFLKWRIARNVNNFVYNDNCLESIDYFKNNVDCMVTTRIHGAILGTLAGVPSLCLVTDSRTYELCEQMGIPYINCMDRPIVWKNKKELLNIFLENCRYSEKLKQTIANMKQKYAVVSN